MNITEHLHTEYYCSACLVRPLSLLLNKRPSQFHLLFL